MKLKKDTFCNLNIKTKNPAKIAVFLFAQRSWQTRLVEKNQYHPD
jgi:hypothetical protein